MSFRSFAEINAALYGEEDSTMDDELDLSFVDDLLAGGSQASSPPPPSSPGAAAAAAAASPSPSPSASARRPARRSEMSVYDIPMSPEPPARQLRPQAALPPQAADNRKRKMDLRNVRTYDPRLASDPSAWWYMTAAGFDNLPDLMKRKYTHIGMLLFAESGAAVAGRSCRRCAKDGELCRVYGTKAREALGGQAPKSCAYCMKSNRTCDAVLATTTDEVLLPPLGQEDDCAACSDKDRRRWRRRRAIHND